MLKDLLPYLGYDINQIPENAEVFFVFNNAPRSWWAFLFLALVISILITVYKLNRKEHEVCPTGIKKFLGFIRVSVFLFICLIFLDPALGVSIKKMIEPQIIVLFDNSASMNIEDKYISKESLKNVNPFLGKSDSASRLNLLKLAAKQYAIDAPLKEKGTLHAYSFDKNLDEDTVSNSIAKCIENLKGDKPNTDITSSVKNAVHIHNGKKIAGVIVVTDGRSNAGAPLSDLTQFMSTQKIPVFTVGIGNPEKSKNFKISEIWLPDRVFKEDPFLIQAKIIGSQMMGDKIALELIEIPINDQGEPQTNNSKIVESKSIIFNSENHEQTISFEHKGDKEGKYIYKVKAVPLAQESIAVDNEKEAQTEILSKSARVLFIAGTSTWDYRMLQTLLVRDKTINVSCWLQSKDMDMIQDGQTSITKLPETEDELFAYDVVLMLDPNPSEFDEKWILMLQKFVEERKGGLMYVAGPNFTSKTISMLGLQKLKEILPVQFTEMQREHKDFMKVTYETQWPLHLTSEGQTHYIGKLNNDINTNKEIWKLLPGVFWSYPVGEAKAGSKVLIEHTDPKLLYKEKKRPLLVTGVFGSGRTIFMGFNGIWRWRKNSDKYFDRFWIQSIRYLIEGKLEKDSGNSNLYTNKEKMIVGDSVNISAKIYDDLHQPLNSDKLTGKIFKGTNLVGEFLLRPEINRKGFYEGEYKPEIQGELTLTLEIMEMPNLKLERNIKVEQPIIEFENVEMNYLDLKNLSDKTNGKFYFLSEFEKLGYDFPNLKEKIVVNLPPDSLWDVGRFFMLIVFLLTIEWTVRKKYKLL